MAESSEQLLIENLPLLERIIEMICTRKGMRADEIEEFAAEVKYRLVKRDYAILKAYENRSSLRTYLAAVVSKLLLEYRNQRWGKWRDSANAQRLGPVAVALERLLYRDKKSREEAHAVLLRQYPSVTRDELEAIGERLAARARRKMVAIEEAESVQAPHTGGDIADTETGARISVIVSQFLDELSDEDQVIFRLRFDSDLTVREISAALHLDQQKVFRRLYRHFETLRKKLKRGGVDASDVEQLIGNDAGILDFRLKNRGARPTDKEESAVEARQEDVSS